MSQRKGLFILISALVVMIMLALGVEYFFGSQHRAASATLGFTAPNYKEALKFSSTVPQDQRVSIQTMFKEVQIALASSSDDFNAWVALGVVRKEAGDYQGAAEVWNYTALRWPLTTVSFNNLGDLYMNFVKDYPKAEANYQKVISLDSANIDAYYNLFILYHELYKTDTSAAADILAQGLKANPGNQYLLSLEAQLKAGK